MFCSEAQCPASCKVLTCSDVQIFTDMQTVESQDWMDLLPKICFTTFKKEEKTFHNLFNKANFCIHAPLPQLLAALKEQIWMSDSISCKLITAAFRRPPLTKKTHTHTQRHQKTHTHTNSNTHFLHCFVTFIFFFTVNLANHRIK